MRPGRGMMNFEFTFDIFVSAAILTTHRDKICHAKDAASVYGCLNRYYNNHGFKIVVLQCML